MTASGLTVADLFSFDVVAVSVIALALGRGVVLRMARAEVPVDAALESGAESVARAEAKPLRQAA